MSKIYLINVGANVAHRNQARGPIFDNGSFEFVSFPDPVRSTPYPAAVRPYFRHDVKTTHPDPDWANLTYGDFCLNQRARALLKVECGDILLFWGLLWGVRDRKSDIWKSKKRGWYLLGAMRVKSIFKSRQTLHGLSSRDRDRLSKSDHIKGQRVEGRKHVRVFLAAQKYSQKFKYAVDLQIYKKDSVLVATVQTKDGRKIKWYERPRWNSVTRACRAILDLSDVEEFGRARILRDVIKAKNPEYDLLADVNIAEAKREG